MFAFDWPWVFLLLPLPLLVYFFTKPVKQEQSAVIIPFYEALLEQNDHKTHYQVAPTKILRLLLVLLLWLLLLTAAARPYWSGEAIALPQSGRDLLLAVDISESMDTADMLIKDLPATRLQVVKEVVHDFIERRKGDRIGLILFGSRAYLQSPLTFDTQTVAQFLDEAQLGFAGPKTAIGDAIGLSAKRLLELNSNHNKILILLTDGANTAGEVDPLQAARLAQQVDIKIYTVGIGADKMTIRGFFGPQIINPSAQLDEKTLSEIAELTQGQYFRAKETQELENIYSLLDQLEPIEQDNEWLKPKRSLYMWPLAFALILSIAITVSQLPFYNLAPKALTASLSRIRTGRRKKVLGKKHG